MRPRLLAVGLSGLLTAAGVQSVAAQSDQPSIDLVVAAGRPFRVALDQRIRLDRVGQPVTGTVTEYIWSNPHVLVKLDVKDESGNVAHWVIEAWNPVTQSSRGWTKNTFKFGDEVIVDVIPAKNNQTVGEFRGRIVINGKEFKP